LTLKHDSSFKIFTVGTKNGRKKGERQREREGGGGGGLKNDKLHYIFFFDRSQVTLYYNNSNKKSQNLNLYQIQYEAINNFAQGFLNTKSKKMLMIFVGLGVTGT
jgi:hypothetical protein